MYVRRVKGEETTFGVSGALWRDALVIYDRTSESYWSQVNATSISGEMKGETLEEIPSVVTTWGEWKAAHPDTLVLEKPPLDGTPYQSYFDSSERMGRGRENPDGRLPGKTLVVGVQAGGGFGAVELERLRQQSVISGRVGEVPVAWVALVGQGAAAYRAELDGTPVDLSLEGGSLVDRRTGSRCSPDSGECESGSLAGHRLQRLPAMRVYWFTWASFHPDTELIE